MHVKILTYLKLNFEGDAFGRTKIKISFLRNNILSHFDPIF
jgi:hypothetical protein